MPLFGHDERSRRATLCCVVCWPRCLTCWRCSASLAASFRHAGARLHQGSAQRSAASTACMQHTAAQGCPWLNDLPTAAAAFSVTATSPEGRGPACRANMPLPRRRSCRTRCCRRAGQARAGTQRVLPATPPKPRTPTCRRTAPGSAKHLPQTVLQNGKALVHFARTDGQRGQEAHRLARACRRGGWLAAVDGRLWLPAAVAGLAAGQVRRIRTRRGGLGPLPPVPLPDVLQWARPPSCSALLPVPPPSASLPLPGLHPGTPGCVFGSATHALAAVGCRPALPPPWARRLMVPRPAAGLRTPHLHPATAGHAARLRGSAWMRCRGWRAGCRLAAAARTQQPSSSLGRARQRWGSAAAVLGVRWGPGEGACMRVAHDGLHRAGSRTACTARTVELGAR